MHSFVLASTKHAYSFPSGAYSTTGAGIYALTSIGFNHSCIPNLLRVSVGPLIIFRTSRPVVYGTIICEYFGATERENLRNEEAGDEYVEVETYVNRFT